ncbi:FUSC family protein [Actinopolyspora mortivallis]|uniref:FUSC family protein n=1 Tax=Actinopolyspora mortivallis TaxID=33906 RepID=A0A2T0GWT6_ACTMO|nr:FUSC family protein [Actinopolyspora mortivallis]PRW63571.1 FUSC family protein [Actinopolyspora mortivallis]
MLRKLQAELSTEAGAPDPRQRQYTTAVLLTVVVATLLGWLLSVPDSVVLAGLTTVFVLIVSEGHSLRADLRLFTRFAPPLTLVMAVGPLLENVPVLAGALVALVVFGTGMLPALGERYRTFGQTFAAATLVATTTGVGSDQPPGALAGCAVLGTLFALLLRVLIGSDDPTRAIRATVAHTLTTPGPGVVADAADAWRTDGGVSWLGQVLAGAARFRSAREVLLAQAQQHSGEEGRRLRELVTRSDEIAAELATAVRSRVCTGLNQLARARPEVLAGQSERELPEAVRGINEGLDRVRAAVLERDTSPTTAPAPGGRRQQVLGAARAHLSLRSALFRHALRCTLAVAAGMVIVLLLHTPTVSTLLLGLYAVLQPTARDSMSGALERTGGAVLGVVLLAVVIVLVPYAVLLVPVAIAAMLLRVRALREDYRLLLAALIGITVLVRVGDLERHSLVDATIGFAANTAIGAAIALAVGFVSYLVLPGSLGPDVAGTVRSTVWSLSELLRSVRASARGADVRSALRAAHVLALRRTQDLSGLPAMLDASDTADPVTEHGARAAATALDALRRDLATLAFRPASEKELALPALRAVDELLGGDARHSVPDIPGDQAPATELLAGSLVENGLHARAAIDETLGHDEPWKSYTISFVRPERLRIR